MSKENKVSQFDLLSTKEDDPKYDFIPDRNPKPSSNKDNENKTETDQSFRTKLEKVSSLAMNFRPQKRKKSRKRGKEAVEVSKADRSKKVASYYLDKDLVKRLKAYADEQNQSSSELVEKAIQNYLWSKEND